MPTKTYLLALCLFVVPISVGHAAEHGKSHADHLEKHFEAEESARRFDDPARDAWQMPDQVIAALNLKQGQSVADIGAGTGYFTVRLAKSNASPKVYAVDIEPSLVKYLRKRAAKEGLANVVVVQASPEDPHLPEPVDLVLVVNTISPYRQPGIVFPEAGRIDQAGRSGGDHRLCTGFSRRATEGIPFSSGTVAVRDEQGGLQAGRAASLSAAAGISDLRRRQPALPVDLLHLPGLEKRGVYGFASGLIACPLQPE